MNLRIFLIITVILLLCHQSYGQQNIILENNDDARQYMSASIASNGMMFRLDCSGVYIKSNFVLTSASCIFRAQTQKFLLRFSKGEILAGIGTKSVAAVKVHIHPKFAVQSASSTLQRLK